MPYRDNEWSLFVSSTFRDLSEERDFVTGVFVQEVRARLEKYGVVLHNKDLRLGVEYKGGDEEEKKYTGRVVGTCLAEVDRTKPLFLAIIGENVGFIPPKEVKEERLDKNLNPEVEEKIRPWLGEKSITQMEILTGLDKIVEKEECLVLIKNNYKNSQKQKDLVEELEHKGFGPRFKYYDDLEGLKSEASKWVSELENLAKYTTPLLSASDNGTPCDYRYKVLEASLKPYFHHPEAYTVKKVPEEERWGFGEDVVKILERGMTFEVYKKESGVGLTTLAFAMAKYFDGYRHDIFGVLSSFIYVEKPSYISGFENSGVFKRAMDELAWRDRKLDDDGPERKKPTVLVLDTGVIVYVKLMLNKNIGPSKREMFGFNRPDYLSIEGVKKERRSYCVSLYGVSQDGLEEYLIKNDDSPHFPKCHDEKNKILLEDFCVKASTLSRAGEIYDRTVCDYFGKAMEGFENGSSMSQSEFVCSKFSEILRSCIGLGSVIPYIENLVTEMAVEKNRRGSAKTEWEVDFKILLVVACSRNGCPLDVVYQLVDSQLNSISSESYFSIFYGKFGGLVALYDNKIIPRNEGLLEELYEFLKYFYNSGIESMLLQEAFEETVAMRSAESHGGLSVERNTSVDFDERFLNCARFEDGERLSHKNLLRGLEVRANKLKLEVIVQAYNNGFFGGALSQALVEATGSIAFLRNFLHFFVSDAAKDFGSLVCLSLDKRHDQDDMINVSWSDFFSDEIVSDWDPDFLDSFVSVESRSLISGIDISEAQSTFNDFVRHMLDSCLSVSCSREGSGSYSMDSGHVFMDNSDFYSALESGLSFSSSVNSGLSEKFIFDFMNARRSPGMGETMKRWGEMTFEMFVRNHALGQHDSSNFDEELSDEEIYERDRISEWRGVISDSLTYFGPSHSKIPYVASGNLVLGEHHIRLERENGGINR